MIMRLRIGTARRMAPAFVALIALVLTAGPVAAAEHYRSSGPLYSDAGFGDRYGTSYLDRYFGGSPVGPIKTTVRIVAHDLAPSTRYQAMIAAGYCASEGYKLAGFTVTTGSTGAVNRTVLMGASARRAIQHAYDHGSPIIVVVSDSAGDQSYCGKLGNPKFIP
jgi:hypothetical protein